MSLLRKYQIQDWLEVQDAQTAANAAATAANAAATAAGNAQTTASGAATAAGNAQTTASDAATAATQAQTTADSKIAGYIHEIKKFDELEEGVENSYFSHEVAETVVAASNIVDVELFENGLCNDDAIVAFEAAVNEKGKPVTRFNVTNLDNPIHKGDKFKFKIAVKVLPIFVGDTAQAI